MAMFVAKYLNEIFNLQDMFIICVRKDGNGSIVPSLPLTSGGTRQYIILLTRRLVIF
jgi:hypothetical protein